MTNSPSLLEFSITYLLNNDKRLIQVSASLPQEGILMVRGPSGAGKSTLLRILARLQAPQQSDVYLQGTPWQVYKPIQWRRRVHYVAQKPAIFNGTVLDNLRLPFQLGSNRQSSPSLTRIQESMERLILLPDMLYQDARTLSGGEAARVALLRAILVDPNVLLLDEPTASLDEKTAQAVWTLVGQWVTTKPHRGIILVSHANELENAAWDTSQISSLVIEPHQETEGNQ